MILPILHQLARGMNVLVLVMGGWLAYQGAVPHAAALLLVSLFNLTMLRRGVTRSTRIVGTMVNVGLLFIGAINLGFGVGGLVNAQGPVPVSPWVYILQGALCQFTVLVTVAWLMAPDFLHREAGSARST